MSEMVTHEKGRRSTAAAASFTNLRLVRQSVDHPRYGIGLRVHDIDEVIAIDVTMLYAITPIPSGIDLNEYQGTFFIIATLSE